MHLDAHTLRDRDRSLATEWLLADGAGGYASSTVLFCGTRRYHGLWVPALKPPVDRRVILSHLEERLVPPGADPLQPVYLSTTEYGGGFFPDGTPCVESFDLEPLPRLVSHAGGVEVQREVLLLREGAGICLTYRVRGQGRWTLDLAPMLPLRPLHALAHCHDRFRIERTDGAYGFRCLCEGMPAVFLWIDGPRGTRQDGGRAAGATAEVSATVSPVWYYNVLRRVERDRGFDCCEDVLNPGHWTVSADGPAEWCVFCSFAPPHAIDVPAERQACLARRSDLAARAGSPKDARLARLARAADAFVVRRRVGREDLATVIAGYHWFGDWGRDTLISLPGLATETGRLDVAEKILRAFAAATHEGLVPNCYAEDSGRPLYNTVDASLLFLQAAAAYVNAGGREDFIRQRLWPVLGQIVYWYREGTAFGIRADSDGLIAAGSADTQLTWMDATSRGRPVTPRHGKAVEINALWISGLALVGEMGKRLGLPPPAAVAGLDDTRRAFEELFWNAEAGCLYDCVLPDAVRDAAVRPNQVFAVSLPHAPLSGERAKSVVRTVREKLLTPRGLRTLSPDDPAYRGRYAGGPDERDSAYHQGTVWPWLLGPYVDAVFAVEDPRCARGEARQILDGLLDSMEEAGLGQIGEVFGGDPPHRPGGCIAQAWSVAAAIHIWKRLEATGGLP
jgi:predicted glycogen debranching enzyme